MPLPRYSQLRIRRLTHSAEAVMTLASQNFLGSPADHEELRQTAWENLTGELLRRLEDIYREANAEQHNHFVIAAQVRRLIEDIKG